MSGEEPTSGEEKPNFQGKYALVRNENFESFLEANGAVFQLRIEILFLCVRTRVQARSGH